MRELEAILIEKAVADAVIDANLNLPQSLCRRIDECAERESGALARSVFEDMKKNLLAAQRLQIPICQDCGMAVIFAEVGQELFIHGDFEAAVNAGVARGYKEGFLRKSVVRDPLRRVNTGDNTPAVIHTRLVSGDRLTLTVAPKGFGSENMSAVKMFNPTASKDDIIDFVVQTVVNAGAKPCPPLVVGVGIGGDFEYAALLSKKALCRDADTQNPDDFYTAMEREALRRINESGIGPQGFSGDCTALACNIEYFPTHIAGLPVAVNIGCHVTRHKTLVL